MIIQKTGQKRCVELYIYKYIFFYKITVLKQFSNINTECLFHSWHLFTVTLPLASMIFGVGVFPVLKRSSFDAIFYFSIAQVRNIYLFSLVYLCITHCCWVLQKNLGSSDAVQFVTSPIGTYSTVRKRNGNNITVFQSITEIIFVIFPKIVDCYCLVHPQCFAIQLCNFVLFWIYN